MKAAACCFCRHDHEEDLTHPEPRQHLNIPALGRLHNTQLLREKERCWNSERCATPYFSNVAGPRQSGHDQARAQHAATVRGNMEAVCSLSSGCKFQPSP